jgi:hypothetical protein
MVAFDGGERPAREWLTENRRLIVDTCKRISCLGLIGLLIGLAGSIHAQNSPAPTVETILARMAQARSENRTRLRPYSVTRDYKLFGAEKQTSKAEIIADMTLVPPDVKHYAIRQANGMGLGEKIVTCWR